MSSFQPHAPVDSIETQATTTIRKNSDGQFYPDETEGNSPQTQRDKKKSLKKNTGKTKYC
jgi:hypothetical protein